MAPGVIDGSLLGLPHPMLDLGERLLDWIEIGGVFWQEPQPGSGGLDGVADGLGFMRAEIVENDDVAGLERRDQLLVQARKHSPLIGPSKTHGAVSRSQRKAPRKVRVRQRPCGAKPCNRLPFGPQPRSGAMLVLIQVSSMKTSRLGSKRSCQAFQRALRRATSTRPCSSANIFLKLRPSRRMNCQIALWETVTPRTASSSFRRCNVRCEVCSIRSTMKARCGSKTRRRCPPILPGATLPVAR